MHEGSPAGELGEELNMLPDTAEPLVQPEAFNKALVTTVFLVPLNNMYPSLRYKEVNSFEEATSKATQVFSIS